MRKLYWKVVAIAAFSLVISVACKSSSDCEKAGEKIQACIDAACKKDPGALYCSTGSNPTDPTGTTTATCDGANLANAKEILGCTLDPETCGCPTSGGTTTSTTTGTTSDTFGGIYSGKANR